MKILAFTDLHGNLNVLHKLKKQVVQEKVDLVLMTGDLTVMGSDLEPLMSRLNTFRAPVFIIHGNHDGEKKMRETAKKLKKITFLHKELIEKDGWWFGGYATGGLRDEYPEQEAWVHNNHKKIEQAAKTGKLIWLDHPPPSNTRVDELAEGWHVGSESLRRFIEKYEPAYVFCGHIHETFGVEDMLNNTIIINSGPTGKIIEL